MPGASGSRRRGRQKAGVAIALVGLAVTCVGALLRRRARARRKRQSRPEQEQSSNTAVPSAEGEPVSSDDWEQVNVASSSSKSAEAVEALEHALIQSYFRCTPQELLKFLFHPDSSFLATWAAASELRGMAAQSWSRQASEPSLWYRTVYYEMPVKASLGPPFANTTERQTLQRAAQGWIARVIAETPNVPFGGRFHTEVLFRAWQLPSGHCALHVSGDIIFTGSTGLLRGTISRATIKGLRATYSTIQHVTSQKLPLGGGLDDGIRLAGGPDAVANVSEKVAATDEKIAVTEAQDLPKTWHMQIALFVFIALWVLTCLGVVFAPRTFDWQKLVNILVRERVQYDIVRFVEHVRQRLALH